MEIRNHRVRDHCMREGKNRSKDYNRNCALAGLRVGLLVIKSLLYPQESWPALQYGVEHKGLKEATHEYVLEVAFDVEITYIKSL